jgi:hypothetical protein
MARWRGNTSSDPTIRGKDAARGWAIPLGKEHHAMFKSSRLLHCLILILGFAVIFDTSVQLGANEQPEMIWQPITEPADEFEIQAISDRPMFVA